MKVTNENIKSIANIRYVQKLLSALLIDLAEFNQLLEDKDEGYRMLYIDYEDQHTEYSLERTDPCPDYFGMYSLRFEKNPYEMVGGYMTLNELDNALCILINFTEFKLS